MESSETKQARGSKQKKQKVKDEFVYLTPSFEDLDEDVKAKAPKQYVFYDPDHRFEKASQMTSGEKLGYMMRHNPLVPLSVTGMIGTVSGTVYSLMSGKMEMAEKLRSYTLGLAVVAIVGIAFFPAPNWGVSGAYIEKEKYEKLIEQENRYQTLDGFLSDKNK